MKLVYWHGWGYDSTFFAPLRKILHDFDAICINEGYFGIKTIPDHIPETAVGIGHSQGFSRLAQKFPHLSGYVSLNGFTQFVQSPAFTNGVPKASLGAMIQQFQRYPEVVLQNFYERTGHFLPLGQSTRNDDLLRQQLVALRSLAITQPSAPTLAISGSNDLITPLALQKSCFPELHVIESANHALIYQYPKDCANLIRKFIQGL